jgi:hypothetical protein
LHEVIKRLAAACIPAREGSGQREMLLDQVLARLFIAVQRLSSEPLVLMPAPLSEAVAMRLSSARGHADPAHTLRSTARPKVVSSLTPAAQAAHIRKEALP